MPRLAPEVVLVVLAVLAGCSGGVVPEVDTTSRTETTVRPSGGIANLPPGLSEESITDSDALADAHAEALANTSFTVRSRHTITTADGSRIFDRTSVRRVAADHSRWSTVTTFERPYPTVLVMPVKRMDFWYNGTHVLNRRRGPNGTEYAIFPTVRAPYPTGRQTLLSYYLRETSTTVSTDNGSITLHLTVRPENRLSASTPRVNVTEQTVTVTLTESGRVERYRTEYAGRLANDSDTSVEGERVVRFTALGETTVERPEWVASARNASSLRSGVRTSEPSY